MSLVLNCGTSPAGVEVKTFGVNSVLPEFEEDVKRIVYPDHLQNNVIHIHIPGQDCVYMTIEDFLAAASYVLTNTDLEDDKDPRLVFIEGVKKAQIVDGYAAGAKRVSLNEMGAMLTHAKTA